MARITPILLAGLCCALMACSSEDSQAPSLGQLALTMAQERMKRGDVETAGGVKKAPAITRQQLQSLNRPVVYVSIPRFGSALPAVQIAKNGATRTFMGADQATVSLSGGIITATRGLLVDLIAQNLSIQPKAMFQGTQPKTYSRSQRHLTGEGTLATFDFTCAIAPHPADETITIFGRQHRVRQYTELCQNKTRAFKNSYWVTRANGTVWQSHQSVSKEVGHVVLQRVVQ